MRSTTKQSVLQVICHCFVNLASWLSETLRTFSSHASDTEPHRTAPRQSSTDCACIRQIASSFTACAYSSLPLRSRTSVAKQHFPTASPHPRQQLSYHWLSATAFTCCPDALPVAFPRRSTVQPCVENILVLRNNHLTSKDIQLVELFI